MVILLMHSSLLSSIQVLSLRTLHEQLLRLLSSEEQQELQLLSTFTPFAGLNPLHHNLYTQPLWAAAVAQYARGMEPAEKRIAGKLRQKLSKLDAHPQQVSTLCGKMMYVSVYNYLVESEELCSHIKNQILLIPSSVSYSNVVTTFSFLIW